MKRTLTIALVVVISATQAQQKITGFTDATSAKEVQTERLMHH